MGLFKTLKNVTNADWMIGIVSKAAGKHRCFTELYKVSDATAKYAEECGPLIAEVVKNKSCYQSKKYVVNCIDSSKVSDEFLEKWFSTAPSVLGYLRREKKPVFFINDIVNINTCAYEWDSSIETVLSELIGLYSKTHVIYVDDTTPQYHAMLEMLGFRPITAGGVVYWRYMK